MLDAVLLASFLAMGVVCENNNTTPPGGYYATKYDHIDVDRVLNSRRLVMYYAACLTNKGPCTPQGLEFKRILPEALRTNCLRCTEKQKVVTLRSIRRLRKEYPKVWAQLTELWDPTGEFIGRFEETFNNPNQKTPTITTTTPSNFVDDVDNRFGDSSKVEVADINVPSVKPYPPPEYTTTTTTNKPSTTKTTVSTTTTTTTEAPHTTTTVKTIKHHTTTPLTVTYGGGGGGFLPPIPNVVSFRPPDLGVRNFVQSLGSIGTKVIQAGSRIAGMLVSSVQSIVGH